METNQRHSAEPRIYVACLAAYSSGRLHGAWINADQKPASLQSEVSAMLKASPMPGAEDFAIHDFEGFEGLHIEEFAGLEQVAQLAAFICEHGRLGAEIYQHFGNLDEAKEALEDWYCGCFPSAADYVETLTAETGQIPEFVARYIDYEAMALDAEMNGDFFTIETALDEVHVFSAR